MAGARRSGALGWALAARGLRASAGLGLAEEGCDLAAEALQRALSAPRRAPPTPPSGGRAQARRGREEKAPPENGVR